MQMRSKTEWREKLYLWSLLIGISWGVFMKVWAFQYWRFGIEIQIPENDNLSLQLSEQNEDSFIHPEPVLPEENIPKFEESPLYLKES